MKRVGRDMLHMCFAILKDWEVQSTAYSQGVDRDCHRLLSLKENHGISFFTISMPRMGKHFDKCLSTGRLTASGIHGFGSFRRRSTIPYLFRDMWSRVFHEDGLLREEPDINAILFLRQMLYAFKKYRMECDVKATEESVREFFSVDLSLRRPSLLWGDLHRESWNSRTVHLKDGLSTGNSPALFDSDAEQVDDSLLEAIQQTADFVSSEFGWFEPSEYRTKHGRGSVADLQKARESKFLFPSWPARLERVFPSSEFAFANYDRWVDAVRGVDQDPILRDVDTYSRLIAVPKTQKGPRLIACEPTANQWCQQAVLDFLSRRLAYTPLGGMISFRNQELNRSLARSASASGSHWTIDLSSASDCVSLWLVERIFRANTTLLDALDATRTSWVRNLVSTKSPEYITLRKFSTQGAATTFPVQSIIYATVILGVLSWMSSGHGVTSASWRQHVGSVRVFGDDLIVPKEAGPHVIQVLTYLGFKVNPDKTFGTGKFRESCGMDAYDGVDVTPAYYLDRYDAQKPSSVATLVDSSNNFFAKGFWNAAKWIESTLPRHIRENMRVVGPVDGAIGFVSFCGYHDGHLRRRRNHELHRYEVLTYAVKAKGTHIGTNDNAALLQYFTEEPSPETNWTAGFESRTSSVIAKRWEVSLAT